MGVPARHERIIAEKRRQFALPPKHGARGKHSYPSSPVASRDDDQAWYFRSVACNSSIGRHGRLLLLYVSSHERLTLADATWRGPWPAIGHHSSGVPV